jgi:beta-lactam-binding protein with PASTA domain
MFKGLLEFIKSKTFLKHLLFYIIAVALVCWIISFWLGSYTSHGVYIKVPDFTGVKLADLDKFVSDKQVKYLVIDSIYDTKAPQGTVIKQEPLPKEEVKDGRTIYLYVNLVMPPSLQMPKLIDRSLRQAAAMLTTYGLKLGKVEYKADQCANCVLEQKIKGKRVLPGDIVKKGSVITLVVGKGLGDEKVGVPCLYGLSRKDAIARLMDNSLSPGAINYDEIKDSASSRVYKQSPSCKKSGTVKMGATVDLFFTANKNKIPLMPNDSSSNNKKDDDKNDEDQ